MKNVNELITYLQEKESFVLAIDGMCASGKTTLAKRISEELDCIVFHIDDFYLPKDKRTQTRLKQPAGHIDYERFEETVLKPISNKQEVHYQPYLCSTMTYSSTITSIAYHPRIIIEGSYSLYPTLLPYYTDIITLRIKSELQKERLLKRNPNRINQFLEKWIPLEEYYFSYYQIFDNHPTLFIE
ncbi:MAG: hypothetical protein RR518_08990 [Coprobacillus sp.]